MSLGSMLGRRFAVDFGQRAGPAPRVSWLLAATGLAVAALAWRDAAPRWERHRDLQAAQHYIDRQIDRINPGAARPSHASLEAAEEEHVRAWITALNRPWGPLFRRFEAARAPDVHLVQMSVDANFRAMHLVAEAPTLDALLGYAKGLEQEGLIADVRLIHHEWRNAPGSKVVVANLSAELAPAGRGREAVR